MLKRKNLFIISLAIISISVAIVYFPKERLLLNRATLILNFKYTPNIFTSQGELSDAFFWLSSRAFLCVRNNVDVKKNSHWNASRYDFITKIETPLPKLTSLINAYPHPMGLHFLKVSPDGNRLWWYDVNVRKRKDYLAVSSIDGMNVIIWESSGFMGQFSWSSNSRNIIGLESLPVDREIHVILLDVEHEHWRKYISLKTENYMDRLNTFITSDGHLIVNEEEALFVKGQKTMKCEIYDLKNGIKLEQTLKTKMPTHDAIRGLQYSDDGKRAFWMVISTYESELLKWLSRYITFVHSRPIRDQALWVSNVDGTDMHEIGHVAMIGNNFGGVAWSPDGKNLSFIYDKSLFTVPAD